jgi:hypothetical protein
MQTKSVFHNTYKAFYSYDDLIEAGIARSDVQVRRMVKAGRFPAPVHPTANTTVFPGPLVREWVEATSRGDQWYAPKSDKQKAA